MYIVVNIPMFVYICIYTYIRLARRRRPSCYLIQYNIVLSNPIYLAI